MAYQNINQYNFRRWGIRPVNEITDICLASDEKDYDQEVVFSPLLIGEDDGNRMPFKFDFNSTGTTICQSGTCTFDNDVIVSENYWNPDNIDPNFCPKVTELCDVGLTGIDNGLVKKMSGETIEITTGLYTNNSDKYSRYKYDRRMKLHPITGFTTTQNRLWNDNSYSYDLNYATDGGDVGYFARLNGGFFQGFYKIPGYDYQVFPQRMPLGWTAEFMLRYRWTGDTSVGLNNRYPDNKGTFFYMGSRAENKFYHYADGEPKQDTGYTRVTSGLTCMETCGCASSANTASTCLHVYQISGGTSKNCSCGCNCDCDVNAKYPEKDPLYDGVSNGLSLRLSGDTGSPRLCIKTYRITGGCETSGNCLTGLTYTTGTSVTEWCSTRGIFDDCKNTPYINLEHWVQIDAVFQRNEWLDTCDLYEKGGLGLITETIYTATPANNSVSLIEPPLTHELPYDPATTEIVSFNDNWTEEIKYRLGTLKVYVNGKLFMVAENFEEIIPRLLDVQREKQIGVGYNISIGGGTQGLKDNLTFSGGCPTSTDDIVYQQDPECLTTHDLDNTIYSGLTTHIKLEEYFGGSMIGDFSAFRMYTEPLNASQIKHNFRILKERYGLLNPDCPNCAIIVPSNDLTYLVIPDEDLVYLVIPDDDLGYILIPQNDLTYELIQPTPTPTETPTNTPTNTQTPTNTETPTQTPSETPTSTPTETPTQTPTNTETSTPTPTNTETPTQTPTNTETPTQTPTNTETPTQTPTPTRLRYSFVVYSGVSYDDACTRVNPSTIIYGESPIYDENNEFYLNERGSNIEDFLPVYYNNEQIVIQLNEDGTTNGFYQLCLTPTPTQTETPTQTPTNTETPTQTPTNTETPTQTATPTNTETSTPTQTPTETETPTPTPTVTPTSTNPTPNRILYWNFSDPISYSGTTTVFDLENNSNGTIMNSPLSGDTGCGTSVDFNGTSQYIYTDTNLAPLFSGTSPNKSEVTSIFMWIYPKGDGVILSEVGVANSLAGWHTSIIEMVSGTLKFGLWNGIANSVVTSSIPTPLNNWYYVGMTYDGSTLTAYVDGVSAGTVTFNRIAPYNSGTGLFYLLAHQDGTNMGDGGFGDYNVGSLEIYTTSLNSTQINENYTSSSVNYICPTPTPTTTPTVTPTNTNTPTTTQTPTNTETPTNTPTNTPTPSVTPVIGSPILLLDGANATTSLWTDTSGNGNNFTLFNSPTISSSDGGRVEFNGTNQYGGASGFADFTNGITVLAFVDFGNVSNWERIIDFGNGPESNNIILARNGTTNNLAFEIYQVGTPPPLSVLLTNGITNNGWGFYGGRVDGSNYKIFSNLVETSGLNSTLPLNVTRNNCYIARSNWGGDAYFERYMGVLAIYDYALSDEEINAFYEYYRGRYSLSPLPYVTPTPTQTPTQTQTPTVTPTTTPIDLNDGLILDIDAFNVLSYSGSGTTVESLVGNYPHTLTNGASYQEVDCIKYFDLSNLGYSLLANTPGPTLPTTGYTYVSWSKIQTNSAIYRTLFRTSPDDHPILVEQGTDNLGFWDNNGGNFLDSGYDVTSIEEVWVQYSVVGDNSTSTFYINNSQVGSVVNGGAGGNLHNVIGNTGGNVGSDQYWGDVSTVKLYGRKLSSYEISQLYDEYKDRYTGICPTPTPTQTSTVTPTNTTTSTPTPSPTDTITIQSFTSVGTTSWTAPDGVTLIEYLIVGGGGGAGNGYDSGGGGGAGGGMVLTGTTTVVPGNSYTVTVGAGGTGGADTRTNNNGTAGGNSVFDTITALGGGFGGGSRTNNPGPAGVGAGLGGASQVSNVSSGVGGNGGGGGNAGGGGGGAVGAGTNRTSASVAGVGGTGLTSSISGSAVTYGRGGNGGTANAGTINGANGAANTGNGGGAGSSNGSDSSSGGNGGSGIVILKY